MTSESAILRAYALLMQGRRDEAEATLRNAQGALDTPSGADLLARIRFEQGLEDDARRIWLRIHEVFPDFEPAAKAIDAFENPPPIETASPCSCHRFKYACAVAIIVLFGVAFSIGKMCGGNGQPEAEPESDRPVVIAEQSIPVRAINGAILRSLKDGILTNMTDSTTLVLLGGTGKYITDRQKRLSIIAECINMEAKIPLSQILFQASDQETNSITLSVRQYNQPAKE